MQLWKLIVTDPDKGARRLVSEYGTRLYDTAVRLCLNESDAEDLVQRTLVRVVQRIGTFHDESEFFTWMCAILVNFYKMDKRGKARNSLVFSEDALPERVDEHPDPAQQLVAEDEARVIRHAVSLLPSAERAAVVLHYFNGFSVPEIARMQRMPEGTIYYRLHQARHAIRGFLSKVYEDRSI